MLLTCVFDKIIKVSVDEVDINPLFIVSLPGYTWQFVLKYTKIRLQTLRDKDMVQLLEINIKGGKTSVMGDRYVISDYKKKFLYIDPNSLYGHSMSQHLTYHETKFDRNVFVKDILNNPDDSDIGYFVEVDLIN